MPIVPYALTTLALVKEYLGIPTSDTSKDAVLSSTINYVSGFIERLCGGRRFLATDYDEIYDSPNGNKLFLNQYPVNSITQVYYRTGTPTAPNWLPLQADSYFQYLKEGYIQVYFITFSLSAQQALRVVYNAGYLVNFDNINDPLLHTLPLDLTMLCNELVAVEDGVRQTWGVSQESTEGQSVTYAVGKNADLTQAQKAIVANYSQFRLTI